MNSRRGVTLMESLVVGAVIAILVALLLPMVGRFQTLCTSPAEQAWVP